LPTEVGGPRNAEHIQAGTEYILDAPIPPPIKIGYLLGGSYMKLPRSTKSKVKARIKHIKKGRPHKKAK
jgi:hypothetical protein